MTTEDAPGAPEARRPVAPARKRRRVNAPLTRIALAGLSASSTFGLVALMGSMAEASEVEVDLEAPSAQPPATSAVVPTTVAPLRQTIIVEYVIVPAAPAGPAATPAAPANLAPVAPAAAPPPPPAPAPAAKATTKTKKS